MIKKIAITWFNYMFYSYNNIYSVFNLKILPVMKLFTNFKFLHIVNNTNQYVNSLFISLLKYFQLIHI